MALEKTKSIKVIGLFAIVVIALVAGFYGGEFILNKKSQLKPTATTVQTAVEQKSNVAQKALDACLESPEKDFSEDGGTRNNLYSLYSGMLALARKDVKLCNDVSEDEKVKKECRDRYYVFASRATGNNECDKIVDKDLVAFCNAGLRNDPSLCAAVSTDNNKNNCRASVSKSEADCAGLSAEFISQCRDNVALAKAFDSKELGQCDQISLTARSGRFNRAECRILLSEKPQEEWNKVYADNVCYEKYAKSVAEESGDSSICEKIPQKDADNKILYNECNGM